MLLVAASAAPDDVRPPASTRTRGAREYEEYEEEGYAAAKARRQEPDAIEAAFPLESYRAGTEPRRFASGRDPGRGSASSASDRSGS